MNLWGEIWRPPHRSCTVTTMMCTSTTFATSQHYVIFSDRNINSWQGFNQCEEYYPVCYCMNNHIHKRNNNKCDYFWAVQLLQQHQEEMVSKFPNLSTNHSKSTYYTMYNRAMWTIPQLYMHEFKLNFVCLQTQTCFQLLQLSAPLRRTISWYSLNNSYCHVYVARGGFYQMSETQWKK